MTAPVAVPAGATSWPGRVATEQAIQHQRAEQPRAEPISFPGGVLGFMVWLALVFVAWRSFARSFDY